MINFSYYRKIIIVWVATVLLLIVVGPVKASTSESLIENNEILLTIRLQNNSKPTVKQQLVFEIEVASIYSFSKPMSYIRPKVKGTADSPRKSPGFTNSKMIDGIAWNTQVKEFAIYPIKEGSYHIPKIEVTVVIVDENNEVIETTLYSKPYDFEVKLPIELKGLEDYIVSSEVLMDITEQGSEMEIFSIGDAFSQTVTVSASDVPGMLLPATLSQKIEGISIYQKPPRLSDKTNRGFLTGKRIDSVTYIFEQGGEYQIEEEIIYWWNPDEQELTKLIIPGKTFIVSGGAVRQTTVSSKSSLMHLTFANIVTFVSFVLFILVLYLVYQSRDYLFKLYFKLTNLKQRKAKANFIRAVKEQKYLYASQLLHDFINFHSQRTYTLREYYLGSAEKTDILNNLLILAYSDSDKVAEKNIQIKSTEVKLLLRGSDKDSSKQNHYNQKIQLNPLD